MAAVATALLRSILTTDLQIEMANIIYYPFNYLQALSL
jgi:hypothetical protein